MKFRNIVIIYIVIIVLLLGGMGAYGLSDKRGKRDMLDLNTIRNRAEQAVREDGEIPDGCEVVLIGDRNYNAKINEALKDDSVIMDIWDESEETIIGRVIVDDTHQYAKELKDEFLIKMFVMWGATALVGAMLLILIYINYIRPFRQLDAFAGQIAKGNLDVPLKMQKGNFFGAFTESFDIMREEMIKARDKANEADRIKHELVAELSHDIGTPVATIKATCEVIELKSSDRDVLDKVNVINSKADTIDKLVTNMLNATLEDLETLRVDARELSSLQIGRMVDELHDYGDIRVENDVPECLLVYDPLRLEQVIDNIVTNSFKYAGTEVMISYSVKPEGLLITIRDFGPGVPEDDLSVITQKYYRGSNSAGKPGSGLGLYIADLMMHKMGGDLIVYNDGGFVVELFVLKAGASPVKE